MWRHKWKILKGFEGPMGWFLVLVLWFVCLTVDLLWCFSFFLSLSMHLCSPPPQNHILPATVDVFAEKLVDSLHVDLPAALKTWMFYVWNLSPFRKAQLTQKILMWTVHPWHLCTMRSRRPKGFARSRRCTMRPTSIGITAKSARTKIDSTATGNTSPTFQSTTVLRCCRPTLTPVPSAMACVQLRGTKIYMMVGWPHWFRGSAKAVPSSALSWSKKCNMMPRNVAKRRFASWPRAVNGKTAGSSPGKKKPLRHLGLWSWAHGKALASKTPSRRNVGKDQKNCQTVSWPFVCPDVHVNVLYHVLSRQKKEKNLNKIK